MSDPGEKENNQAKGENTPRPSNFNSSEPVPGTQIGQFRIERELGRGAIGIVYLAQDTKLGRTVAIKSLSTQVLENTAVRSRFSREARILASLNHPGIAAIYEELEQIEGTGYLILEYIPGQTLTERITETKLELDEALSIALQIAEAVAAAHECGIIHRDLKPGNIKITPDDKVKVLDFGIAKPVKADVSDEASTVTQPGRIIGTPTYMSPEQARGKPTDKRSDIWSFGCVLYEMLTGKVPFEGETVSDTLANVLQTEPDWTTLPQNTPANIRVLLRRCLEKDPRRRLRDIGDAAIEISETQTGITASFAPPGETAVVPRLFRRDVVLVGLTCLIIGMLVAGVIIRSTIQPSPPVSPSISRLSINLPAEKRIFFGESNPNCYVAISPDGTHLVYVGGADRQSIQLYTRLIDDLQIKPIPGTKGARNPFFSPDGQWVGFFTTHGELKKVSLSGGEPVTLLGDIQWSSIIFGSWGEDNYIVFDGNLGLRRISADGGDPKILIASDSEQGYIWPRFPHVLPGSQAIIYTLAGSTEVFLIETNQRKTLLDNAVWAQYIPSGYLLFIRNQSLVVASFDIKRFEVTGPAIPVVENIRRDASRFVPQMTVSKTGTLAYAVASNELGKSTLIWADRQGQTQTLDDTPRDYRFNRIRLSPDGLRIATQLTAEGLKSQVYLFDITRRMLIQFTTEGKNTNPEWSPDGKRLAFLSERNGGSGLYCKYVDGSSPDELLASGSYFPCSWSKDGKFLACMRQDPGTVDDIWIITPDGDSEPQPFLNTRSWEDNPRFSPDGRWIAYTSSESGKNEVYIQQYPEGGRKIRISSEGGASPVWVPDGSELFYSNGTEMMVVEITPDPNFSVGKPHPLFDVTKFSIGGNFGPGYDVTPDGRRFVILEKSEKPEVELIVVQNWFKELE